MDDSDTRNEQKKERVFIFEKINTISKGDGRVGIVSNQSLRAMAFNNGLRSAAKLIASSESSLSKSGQNPPFSL